MDSIITYLIAYNQYLITIIGELLLFIVQYIPLKQMVFDDSNSPEYQKFKVDKLPTILKFEKVDYKLLLAYYKHKYNKNVKPVQRRNGKSIPKKIKCPKCGAPHEYIYDNNGNKGQFKCKICQLPFKETNYATKPIVFICPYCGATLTEQNNVSTLKYINVIILNAHIIKEILRSFLRILILPININTSFIIYTVNSILTSLRWIYIQYQNMLQDLILKSSILI